jgi:FkbM family methyltransferase
MPSPPGPVIEEQHLRVKRCRYGWMLYSPQDRYVGRSFDRYGEFSELEARAFAHLIKPGQTVYDVGANIGAHTLAFARFVGETGLVAAFEPQRQVFQMLCANVALNGLARVWTIWAACGRERGQLHVPQLDYRAPANVGGVSLSQAPVGEAVPTMALDDVGTTACHFIKIDVEGMEAEVIAGAQKTIAKWRPLLYVENDRREKSAALIQQIMALDYRLYWHNTALYNPNNLFGESENVFGNIVSINMLCVPREVELNLVAEEIKSPLDDWRRASPQFS